MARKAKKRQRAPKQPRRFDTHHLIWVKRDWNNGSLRSLRSHWYFRVPLPKQTLHAQIHHEMTHIPVPKAVYAKQALEYIRILESRGLIHQNDPAERRLFLLAAIFDGVAQPTADALRQQAQIISKFYKNHARS